MCTPAAGPVAGCDRALPFSPESAPEGAAWAQHYFPSSDGSGTVLHADISLPEGQGKGEKVPVILSAGSSSGHSGQAAVAGRAQTSPLDSFADQVEGIDLFDRGYALVLVDAPGLRRLHRLRQPR